MAVYISDFGDYYDKIEYGINWDFREDNIPIYWINKYPYKARTLSNAEKLALLRDQINILCYNLEKNKRFWKKTTNNKEYINGVDVFLGIHCENYDNFYTLPNPFYEIARQGFNTSKYLLSEIPKGTMYAGLNKPKMRYVDYTAPHVGKDKNGRALYRDIFLDLNRSEKSLKMLIIHELAHTMANHIFYRPEDHHADFKWCEKLIAKYWPN